MSSLLTLLPLALMFALYVVFIKAAAKIYRKSRLSWKHAVVFSGFAIMIGGIGAILNRLSGFALGPLLGVMAGLATQSILGGWYLGPRTMSPIDGPIGFKGGMLVAAIGYGIVVSLGIVSAIVLQLLNRGSPA